MTLKDSSLATGLDAMTSHAIRNDLSSTTGRSSQVDDLRAVLEVSRKLAATTKLPPLLEMVEGAARSVLCCARATIFLYDSKSDELYSQVATGVEEIRFKATQGIAGEAVRTADVIIVPDAYADERFNPEIDKKTGFRTRNMITIPMLGIDGDVVGVLQLLNKTNGEFDDWDHELARTFGAQVGVALQRQLLLEHFEEKQRLERDMNIARDIQQGLLPKAGASAEGFEIAGWNRPADETGGDCYDYCENDDGSLAVTVADATGHGIGAALMIAECRALFRAASSISHDVKEITTSVNDLLCDDLPDDRFVTAFFGIVCPQKQSVTYLSAGHGPIILYRKATDTLEELPANGFPLGIMTDAPWPDPDVFEMQSGDMLVVVTDGFFEWQNKDREQFGTTRLCESIRRASKLPCAELIAQVHRNVCDFVGAMPQDDDLTALVIRKL